MHPRQLWVGGARRWRVHRLVCRLANHTHEHGEGVNALGSAKCSEHT
jgi:hypothetical protein